MRSDRAKSVPSRKSRRSISTASCTTGVTTEDPPMLVPLDLPKPMYGLAVELKSHADETKFSDAMHKLQAEDPCLVLERVAATKQTVLRGLGELHLRVVLEKLSHQYGIELETSQPKVAYKETITRRAEGHYRHKKQTGGAGQFGEVYLRDRTAAGRS